LEFLKKFESEFISQGQYESRGLYDSLNIAWKMLDTYPAESLSKIKPEIIAKYHKSRFNEE